MDFDLKELSSTLVLGAYVIVGLATILTVLLGLRPRIVLQLLSSRIGGENTRAWYLVILAISVMVSGVVAEDVSNLFVDVYAGATSPKASLPLLRLPKERDLRLQHLLGTEGKGNEDSLARQLARGGRISYLLGTNRAAEFEERIAKGDYPTLTDENAIQVCNAFYYRAKNVVYQHPEHFQELLHVQGRIDFCRAFSVVSVTFALVTIGLVAGQMVLMVLRVLGAGWFQWVSYPTWHKMWILTAPADAMNHRVRLCAVLLARGALFVTVFLGIYCAGRKTYESEEREFNVRVFGYYGSLGADTLPKVEWPNDPEGAGWSRFRASVPAVSGMAQIDAEWFLVVHDSKAGRGGPLGPVGYLRLDQRSASYTPAKVDWGVEGEPNDLESVCKVPGVYGRFLVCESGYYGGNFGRIFELAVDRGVRGWNAKVVAVGALPADSKDIEGCVCIQSRAGGRWLILAMRGKDGQPATLVRCQMKVQGNGKIILDPDGAPQALVAPFPGERRVGSRRHCSDLFLDDVGTLWASGAEDPDKDMGPFGSVVFRAGRVSAEGDRVVLEVAPELMWTLDGSKVEAIGPPCSTESALTVASDDEGYGGVVRPLGLRR